MKNPKFFLAVLSVVFLVLLFIDLPFAIKLPKVNVPFINQTLDLNLDPSRMNLSLGPVKFERDFAYKLGLDLQGGTRFTYQIDMKGVPEESQDDAFAGVRTVIDRRVNFF